VGEVVHYKTPKESSRSPQGTTLRHQKALKYFEIMKHVETHRDSPVGCPRLSPDCEPLAACSDG
jgi:hypothetical protein